MYRSTKLSGVFTEATGIHAQIEPTEQAKHFKACDKVRAEFKTLQTYLAKPTLLGGIYYYYLLHTLHCINVFTFGCVLI